MGSFFRSDADNVLAALDNSLAIIEFDPAGKILRANENFCSAMGYQPSEIVGQHHRMFVDPDEVHGPEYAQFWQSLAKGEFQSRVFRRLGKGGREIWIRATYNPVMKGGKVYKVVKFASDITEDRLEYISNRGKIDAIMRAQAVIEFTPDGEILDANDNFLTAMGYRREEIVGKHHRLFVEPSYASSGDYSTFWSKLKAGEYFSDEFKRIGKGGRVVWIQATYNPIFDPKGRVVKVVKFATDVTGRVNAVNEVGMALERLAGGDLQQRIKNAFIAVMDPLRVNLNASLGQLQEAMAEIGGIGNGIESGASQVRVAADDLAQRTEQQAAALEQTSGALAELNSSVRTSSQRADEAGHLVRQAKSGAEQSGAIVARAVQAMAQIEKSSDEINKIIGVIDEIAFQTNLLALNAGVEAARAGEAGKGFAVVAQEVRALAQRSAEAAKEIKGLISTSGQHVATGVELVNETGRSLEMIVTEVAEINNHVGAIVDSAKSQAVGLSEISTAVEMLNQATQQNAAMVEESTAASTELASEAQHLMALLGRFKVEENGSPVHGLTARVVRAFG
ncbi:methyl-accepting chemotaxis protein [Consotaella aegiceratis]|uniref:methyl-accepting chemotaxis protein n=1 Tax=Consotaella aegiceratis TaxID=3097961 RepID=UPI002F404D16